MPATDVHQHLWPESLLGLLAARDEAPRLRRGGDGWQLECAGEAPAAFDARAHDPAVRAELAAADEIERVLVAPSSPLGIESLPAAEAQPLLDAFLTPGCSSSTARSRPGARWRWPRRSPPPSTRCSTSAPPASACRPRRSARRSASTRSARCSRSSPERRAPLFVHPGPAPAGDSRLPAWWPPMTSYVAEMQAAWLAWAEWGRPAHPSLKVVWAMLAGCAPLQAERLAARGGPAAAVHDELAWFDVSSYGPHAVDAMLRVVGVDRLVLGSDRPIADPPALASLGPAVRQAVSKTNPARLFAA